MSGSSFFLGNEITPQFGFSYKNKPKKVKEQVFSSNQPITPTHIHDDDDQRRKKRKRMRMGLMKAGACCLVCAMNRSNLIRTKRVPSSFRYFSTYR
jgi:hypothetical protein